mmetsp:Transcript_20076/g.46158  ORF Transcript_20076/g.46158 Transcript_20076/m.46158 type:complete len:220 (+) Transcript_20076:62-721(+)
MLRSIAEVFACVCFIATFTVVVYGIFGNVAGGGMDFAGWFPWHPVLMSLSFPCLMGMGRLANVSNVDLAKDTRRLWHGTLMGAALVTACVGYLCIFMAHWPKKKFLGYDFQSQAWDPDWTRIAHAWLGYGTLAASLLQGFVGPLKMRAISAGDKVYTWHGTLGKLTMLGAMVVLSLAVTFQSWAVHLKILILMLVIASASLGAFLPRLEDPEGLPLTTQ